MVINNIVHLKDTSDQLSRNHSKFVIVQKSGVLPIFMNFCNSEVLVTLLEILFRNLMS